MGGEERRQWNGLGRDRMGWDRIVQLEEICNSHQVQLPDNFRTNQKLKYIIEGIIQIPLEHWQEHVINYLFRMPVSPFEPEHDKEYLG